MVHFISLFYCKEGTHPFLVEDKYTMNEWIH